MAGRKDGEIGFAITESVINEYGKEEILRRLSDPSGYDQTGIKQEPNWNLTGSFDGLEQG